MQKRIDAKVRELKTSIIDSVTQAYDDALWASPVTHRHHLRMGFHSDPYISGRARRWQGVAQDDSDDSGDEEPATKSQRIK